MNVKSLLATGGRPLNQLVTKSFQNLTRNQVRCSSHGGDHHSDHKNRLNDASDGTNLSNDPLFYGDVSMASSDIPPLNSGARIYDILERKSVAKRLIDAPIRGPKESLDFFQRIFPEVTEWNQVGKYSASNASWNRCVKVGTLGCIEWTRKSFLICYTFIILRVMMHALWSEPEFEINYVS